MEPPAMKYARQPVQELIKDGHTCVVPEDYVLPEEDRPKFGLKKDFVVDHVLPVIDMEGVGGEHHDLVVEQIQEACEKWGFFHVKNHGVPLPLITQMQKVCSEFFELPFEEKIKYRDQSSLGGLSLGAQGYGSKVAAKKGAISNWGDQLRHKSLPLSLRDYSLWPTNPVSFRKTEEEYLEELDKLEKRILDLISESLGLKQSYLNDYFCGRSEQHLLVNYYPSCPQPDLVLGIQAHSDFGLLTLLVQDVAGLQVMKDREWIDVAPVEGSIIVNVADQLEILSNGRFTSAEHRVFVSSKPRMSIVAFTGPSNDTTVEPLCDLLSAEEVPKYKQSAFGEYKALMYATGCSGKSHIQNLLIKS